MINLGWQYLRKFGVKRTCAAVLLYASRKLDMAIDPYTVDQFVLKDLPNVPKRATLEIPFTKELSKYDFKQSDLLINSQILDKWRRTSNRTISSINWFVPDFLNELVSKLFKLF
jgi:hypothetical protein